MHTPGPTRRGMYGGSDAGRQKKKLDAGMDDARSALAVSLAGLKAQATGGIQFGGEEGGEEEVEGEEDEEEEEEEEEAAAEGERANPMEVGVES